MSYDLKIAVKDEFGLYVKIGEPELCNPTYNIGEMLRKAMDWDFKQDEYYPLKDVYPNIKGGINELRYRYEYYKQYNAPNGWGTTETAFETLKSLDKCINDFVKWQGIPLDHMYVAW